MTLQTQGREPSIEEIAQAGGLPIGEVRRGVKASRHPLSLERPVGEHEDS